MAIPIHYRRIHGPASSDNIDDNFLVLATAVEELQAAADDGVQIDTITLDDTGAALIITMTDARTFGPFPIGGSIRPMGDHQPGLSYLRGDIVGEDGSSYLCMIPHEADVLADDLALGRWMVLAQAGAAGDGGGGGGGGAGNIFLTGYMKGDIISDPMIGSWVSFAIPKASTLVAITAHAGNAAGTSKSASFNLNRFTSAGAATGAGNIVFTGTERVGVPGGGAIGFDYAAADYLYVGYSGGTSGHTLRDVAITLELELLP